MKINFITLLLSLFIISCSTVKNEDLTENQKTAIKYEIQQLFEYTCEGISELNAEKAFSLFSINTDTKYIRNGHLYPDIETAKNQYAEWFNSPSAVKQNISLDPVIFDIINKKTVLMTTIGYITKADTTITNEAPWVIAYTLLWIKEKEGWKVLNMHNSWE